MKQAFIFLLTLGQSFSIFAQSGGQGKGKDSASYCFETYRLSAPPDDSAGPRKRAPYVLIKNDCTLFLLPMAGVNDLAPLLSTIKAYRLHYEMTVGVVLQTDTGRKKIDELLEYTAVDLADTTTKIRMFISTRRHSLDEHIRSGTGPEKYIFFDDLKRHLDTDGEEDKKPLDRGNSARRKLQVTPRDPKNPPIPITMGENYVCEAASPTTVCTYSYTNGNYIPYETGSMYVPIGFSAPAGKKSK
jgi:hypothetical protein